MPIRRLIVAAMICSSVYLRAAAAEPLAGAYVHLTHTLKGIETTDAREAALREQLDRFKASGLTTVMPYVVGSSQDAFFPSTFITDHVYGDWDPLAFIMTEAHARGLKVMPVVCVLTSGHDTPRGPLKAHPEWALRKKTGEVSGYISSGNAEARAWIVGAYKELVERYKPDGLLLDYLRYPNEPMDFDPATRARFVAETGREKYDIADRKAAQLQGFKEAQLTQLAKEIHDAVKGVSPTMPIALYCWGPHVAKEHFVAQTWPQWVAAGYIDIVNVSGYCYRDNYGERFMEEFSDRLTKARALMPATRPEAQITFCLGVVTSHGKVQSAAEIGDYLRVGKATGMQGVAVFTFNTLATFQDEVVDANYFGHFFAQ